MTGSESLSESHIAYVTHGMVIRGTTTKPPDSLIDKHERGRSESEGDTVVGGITECFSVSKQSDHFVKLSRKPTAEQ